MGENLLVPAADIERFDRSERRREYAESAKADGTWRVYDGHWKRFVEFCAASGSSAGPPASHELVADWIIALESEGKSANTLGVAVAAQVVYHGWRGLAFGVRVMPHAPLLPQRRFSYVDTPR